jgi:ubiquinone/menaquinone biosynthesis C-methylase UbiE
MLFEKFVNDYARYRPGYPDNLLKSLIKDLSIGNDSAILDLACGTGNLANHLLRHIRARIYGIDRSLTMLKKGRNFLSVCALAEWLPVKDNIFKAVITGQAFHWFDFKTALDEVTRILKPGGGLGIIWYQRKRPLAGHQLEMNEIILKYNPDHKPFFMEYDWRSVIEEHGGLRFQAEFETDWLIKYTILDYLKLQRSKSYVGDTLPPDRLTEFMAEFEAYLKINFPDNIVPERLAYFYVSAIKS